MSNVIDFYTNFKPSGNFNKDRMELRKIVINKFLQEKPGRGRGTYSSTYRYNVEKLSDGRKIYLTRPAPLREGFDFIIHVENRIFASSKDNPSFDDIFDDLIKKKMEDFNKFKKLYYLLLRIYRCEEPDDVIKNVDFEFNNGLTIEEILKIVKWFFIEQDIRYWNYSGREMFKTNVIEKALEDP